MSRSLMDAPVLDGPETDETWEERPSWTSTPGRIRQQDCRGQSRALLRQGVNLQDAAERAHGPRVEITPRGLRVLRGRHGVEKFIRFRMMVALSEAELRDLGASLGLALRKDGTELVVQQLSNDVHIRRKRRGKSKPSNHVRAVPAAKKRWILLDLDQR